MEGLQKSHPGEMLQQTAELARLAAEATSVKAPRGGKILDIYIREGERVSNTPILLMANLDQMDCVAEVHEANLKTIETTEVNGKLVPERRHAVTMNSIALDRPLTGEVREVGRLIGAPKLRDPNPLARTDQRTAEVRIKLDDDCLERARKLVHLQVNVIIHLEENSE